MKHGKSFNAALAFFLETLGTKASRPARERTILRLERLEEIEAAGSLIPLLAPTASVALIRTPMPDDRDNEFASPTFAENVEERAVLDSSAVDEVFAAIAAMDEEANGSRQPAERMTGVSRLIDLSDAAPWQHRVQADLPADPLLTPPPAPRPGPYGSRLPGNIAIPPNLAGAFSGGSLPGGSSTGGGIGGGGSNGNAGGGGGGTANLLNRLGVLGDFSPQTSSPPSSGNPGGTGVQPWVKNPPPPGGSNPPINPDGGGQQQLLANNDAYTLLHDSTLSIPAAGVLANDTGPSGWILSAVLASGPSHGTLSLQANGSFIYMPTAHYTGTDTFSYYATSNGLQSNTAFVTLTINDPHAPAATPDSYSVLHDQVLTVDASNGVLANDSDADNDSLTASLATGPSHGALTLDSDGSFVYTPTAGYVGSDSFTYKASDGVLSSAATTVTLTVTDNAPTVVSHSYGIPENTSESVTAAFGLLNGASDADGDALTASLVSNPSHGTVTVNSDGSFTFTPATGYTGSDSFQYKGSDGAESSTATVSLTIHGTDTAPIANAASYTWPHDQELTVTADEGVLTYASDPDNDPLTAILVSGPTNGTLTLNSDGSFLYTPNADYVGNDTFQYEVSDGSLTSSAATVTINVTNSGTLGGTAPSYTVERNNTFYADASTGLLSQSSDSDDDSLTAQLVSGPSDGTIALNPDGSFSYTPNTNFTGSDSIIAQISDGPSNYTLPTIYFHVNAFGPVAYNDSYSVQKNSALIEQAPGVLANDVSPDKMPLTAEDVTLPSHGTLTLNGNGSFMYTPSTNFVGADSFTYKDSDGFLTSNTATVFLDVTNTNTPPTAQNVSYTLAHDTSLTTDATNDVLAGASDGDGDPLTAILVNGPSNGALTFNNDGSFTYTPNVGYFGNDSFTFQAFDGTYYSSTATATLNVTNDAPTAVNDIYSVLASGATTVSADNGVLMNDTDGEDDLLSAVLISQPTYGSLTFNSDGSFSFTPGANFRGSDSFTYEAYDSVNYSNAATVTLTTTPVAANQSYTVNHDTTLSVDSTEGLLAGAYDADGDTLTAALATGPTHGTVAVNSDGSFTYSPALHYTGTDSFTFTVSDGSQTSVPATATITVTNSVPEADDALYSTGEYTAVMVNAASGVLAYASDDDGDSLTAELVGGTANGVLQLSSNGAFTYTPNSGFIGVDSFTYEVSDGVSASNMGTVWLNVTSSNFAPVVSVTAITSSAAEASPGQYDEVQFSRSGSTASPLTVNYFLTEPDDNGVEYALLSGSVTIPAGQSSVNLIVQPIADPNQDPAASSSADPGMENLTGQTIIIPIDDKVSFDDSVTITVAGSSVSANAYIIGSASSVTVTIQEDDYSAMATPPEPPWTDAPSSVVFAPWTIGQQVAYIKEDMKKDPKFVSQWLPMVKNTYGDDLTNEKVLESVEKLTGLFNVRALGPFVYADFFGMTRFSANLNGNKYSIIQMVNVKQVQTDNEGKQTTTQNKSWVEGWVVLKDGNAAGNDQYSTMQSMSLNTQIGNVKSITMTATFTVGVGLYDNEVITGNRGDAGSVPGVFDIFSNDPQMEKVTWKGETRDYTVQFTLNKDGTWSWSDPAASIYLAGKFNATPSSNR